MEAAEERAAAAAAAAQAAHDDVAQWEERALSLQHAAEVEMRAAREAVALAQVLCFTDFIVRFGLMYAAIESIARSQVPCFCCCEKYKLLLDAGCHRMHTLAQVLCFY